MLDALRLIAERKIIDALRNGEINYESWKGRPLPLDEGGLVPEELRMAYKMLKNAGYLPPELEVRKEISRVEELIVDSRDEYVKVKQLKKLNFLLTKLSLTRPDAINLEQEQDYFHKIVDRISVKK